MALLATRKRAPQVRGVKRRARLISAARTLLSNHELDSLSLAEIAKHAGVPASSAYHFYSDVRELYAALLSVIETELLAEYRKPLRKSVRSWPDVIGVLVTKGAQLYAADPAARQLMVGPKSPPDLKMSDRGNDVALGRLYHDHVAAHFRLPTGKDWPRIFFRAVEIIDLMFCLSMIESGNITEEYTQEAVRAAVGYLGTHIAA